MVKNCGLLLILTSTFEIKFAKNHSAILSKIKTLFLTPLNAVFGTF